MTATPTPETIVVKSLCGYSVSAKLGNPGSDNPVVVREVLTDCCSAGTQGSWSGIRCKECYEVVDMKTSGGSRKALDEAARAKSCPDPASCADHMIWEIDRELGIK